MIKQAPSVIIHYPEELHRISIHIQEAPQEIVSWVYNANTKKQHRDIAFYRCTPDFRKVRQPYKNPNDKRVKKLIEQGSGGAPVYDWWNIQQVKNVSKEKTSHPCQMPLEVMDRIIKMLPECKCIIDPFCGSGTTGIAAVQNGLDFIGIDVVKEYADIARERIKRTLNER